MSDLLTQSLMSKAGKALKQVLETHNISQAKLAMTMGIGRSTVHYWVSETRDPLADSIPEILEALQKLNEAAAKDFLKLYLGEFVQDDES